MRNPFRRRPATKGLGDDVERDLRTLTENNARRAAESDALPPGDPRRLKSLTIETQPVPDPLKHYEDSPTIGPGDPMWEVFQRMLNGETDGVLMGRNDDDTWTVEDIHLDQD